MSKKIELGERPLFNKIRAMSNEYRFRILELAEAEKMCITELSSTLKLSYMLRDSAYGATLNGATQGI